jgi:LPPG:FO 2-phospho-L-lactate transferase
VSIGPILGVPGMREALRARRDGRSGERRRGISIVAVSGIIGGKALKGPADRMLASLGEVSSAVGVAARYGDFITKFVIDDIDAALLPAIEVLGPHTLVTDTIMGDDASRVRLAGEVLDHAGSILIL